MPTSGGPASRRPAFFSGRRTRSWRHFWLGHLQGTRRRTHRRTDRAPDGWHHLEPIEVVSMVYIFDKANADAPTSPMSSNGT